MTVPACSSGTFDHCAATLECHVADTGYDTPIPSHINRPGDDISLCYPLIRKVTLEATTTCFRPRNPVSSFHTKSSS